MIRTSSTAMPLHARTAVERRQFAAPRREAEPTYGRTFWFTYLSNLFITTANATMFRYGDFVSLHDGTELELGVIVGAGMIGSLLMRAAQGVGIDTYGVRRIWIISSVGYVLACVGHLWVQDIHGPGVYALRILYQTSLAGIFGASITYISRQAPVYRMTEVVGTLGTSGFLGMILGALIVDKLYGSGAITASSVERMFWAAAVMGLVSGVLALLATRKDAAPMTRRRVPVLWLLKRYHPGPLLLMGITQGFGLGLATTFLRPFTASLGIDGIATFFTIYAVTAFVTRLSIRRLPERVGIRRMVILGVGCLAASMLSYLAVRAEWELAFPAVLVGVGHAFLFPAVTAGGSASFPRRYRGLGTTLMLTMFDLGMLLGSPATGAILGLADSAGLPKYPTLFVTLSVLFAAATAWYAMATRGQLDPHRAYKLGPGVASGDLAIPATVSVVRPRL
jgi:MFS family permease